MIGQTLGHCRITAKIGEGGMGVVYRAYDEVLHRDVAVKVVKKDARLDASASQNLLHEARASSSLAHPNICTIYDVGETDGDLYIVMELVEGKSLQTLSSGTGLPAESVLRYGIQIASGLARAHDRGIVHRDLKTSNIVATPDGLIKVLDFGLAKRVGGGVLDAPTLSFSTLQGASSVSGTLPYMAPEILRGEPADARSDLWALGVVLYELACGKLPFEGGTGFEISSAILREIPKPLGPPVPPGLWAILQRCLAQGTGAAISARQRSSGGSGGHSIRSHRHPGPRGGSERLPAQIHHAAQRAPRPHQKRRFSPIGGDYEGSVYPALQFAAPPLGGGRPLLSRPRCLRARLRSPWRSTPHLGFDLELLGNAAALQRRFWQELDQPATGSDPISLRHGRLVEKHLANHARPSRRTGGALLRRRACSAVRKP